MNRQIDYHDDFETALKKINDYEMTRDERAAISILNAYKVGYERAMEDLKQEPCDDAISHDAEIKKLKEQPAKVYTDKTDYQQGYIDGVNQMVKELKSETVTEFADRCRECGKMRKGHWIYDETIENWRCSKCNETPKTMGYVGTADFMAEHFKFCNHCGCHMVEPQERSDKE